MHLNHIINTPKTVQAKAFFCLCCFFIFTETAAQSAHLDSINFDEAYKKKPSFKTLKSLSGKTFLFQNLIFFITNKI